MSYFPEHDYYQRKEKKRPGLFAVFVVALIASFLGSYLFYTYGDAVRNQGAAENPAPNAPQNGKTAVLPPMDAESEAIAAGRVVAVAKNVGPAVVGISNQATVRTNLFSQPRKEEVGSGSGVIYDQAGYIVTNHHVVDGAEEISVVLSDGRTAKATLVGSDQRSDLAVIKIDLPNLPVAKFGDSSKLSIGELAIAIGNPGGMEFAGSVTTGIISGLNRQLKTQEGPVFNLIQTDAAINPGNSGGALLNSKGEVVGINSIKIAIPGFEGMGFAIPSNYVTKAIDELRNQGRVVRPALGVALLFNIDKAIAAQYGLKVDYGVVVRPSPGGAAAKAGMRNNDIIIALGDKPIRNDVELQRELFQHKVGETVEVTILRDNNQQKLSIQLGELAAR